MTLLQEGLLTSLTIILLFSTRGTPLPQMFERSNSDISSFPSDVVGSDYLFNSPDQTPSTTGMTASDPETLALDGSSAAPVVHIAAAVKGSNSCPAPLKQNPSSQELPVQPDLNSLPLPSNADQQRPIPDLPPIPRCPGKQISLCCSGRLQDLGYVLDCIKHSYTELLCLFKENLFCCDHWEGNDAPQPPAPQPTEPVPGIAETFRGRGNCNPAPIYWE